MYMLEALEKDFGNVSANRLQEEGFGAMTAEQKKDVREMSEPKVKHATGWEIVHTLGRKGVGGLTAYLLGLLQGYSGEYQVGGTAGDPTSGWGLKATLAITFTVVEVVQMIFGWYAGKHLGYLGVAIDGGIEGIADAALYSWLFDFGNTSGLAKRASEKQAAAAGFDYDRRKKLAAGGGGAMGQGQGHAGRREMAEKPNRMSDRVAQRRAAAMSDPYYGYY